MTEDVSEPAIQLQHFANAGGTSTEGQKGDTARNVDIRNDRIKSRLTKIKVILALLALLTVAAFIAIFVMIFQLRAELDKADQNCFTEEDLQLYLNRSDRRLLTVVLKNSANNISQSVSSRPDTNSSDDQNRSIEEDLHLNRSEHRLLTDFLENAADILQSVRDLKRHVYTELHGWKLGTDNMAYKKFSESVDYYTERSRCKNYEGGRLVSKTLRDPSNVRDMIAAGYQKSNFWIGLTKSYYYWNWADNGDRNELTTAWRPGEPNDFLDGNEDCAEVVDHVGGGIFLLNDLSCEAENQYVCEIPM